MISTNVSTISLVNDAKICREAQAAEADPGMLLFLVATDLMPKLLRRGDAECVQAILATGARPDEVNFDDLIRARRPTETRS